MLLIGSLCASFLLVVGSAAPGADLTLDAALADLKSPSADQRFRAERWIATRAQIDDFPRLAEALESGDAELRRRVIGALGGEDRNMGLAVLLAGELRPVLRTAGRAALEEMLLRWAPEIGQPALVRGALRERLLELHDSYRPRVYELDLASPLSISVGLLAQHADAPLALVVDPVVADLDQPDRSPSGAAARGVWDQMLVYLAERDGLGLEGFGLGDDGEGLTRGFLRVCRLRDEGRRQGVDLVLEWVGDAAHAKLPVRRTAAARALAATEWPAAVQWLTRRWLKTSDPAALDGVLVAASRGRVAPSLAREEVVERILNGADADLAAADALAQAASAGANIKRERAWLALDALAALPPFAADGSSLVEPLTAGWDSLGARQRWLRLAVLERVAPGAPRLASLATEILSDSLAPNELRVQALRALIASRGSGPLTEPEPLDVPRAEQLLAATPAFPPEGPRALVHLFLEGELDPPARIAKDLSSAVHASAALEWCVGRGNDELAFAVLEAGDWLRTAELQRLSAEFLRDLSYRAESSVARGFLGRLRAHAGQPAESAVARLEVLGGFAPVGAHTELFNGLDLGSAPMAEEGSIDGLLPEVLGALAAGPAGDRALAQLRTWVDRALPPAGTQPAVPAASGIWELHLRRGLERALEELLLSGRDRGARIFLDDLRRAAAGSRADSRSALRAYLLQADWPPAPRSRAERLGAQGARLRAGALRPGGPGGD